MVRLVPWPCKGSVGKSTFTVNLAWSLRDWHLKAGALDLDTTSTASFYRFTSSEVQLEVQRGESS